MINLALIPSNPLELELIDPPQQELPMWLRDKPKPITDRNWIDRRPPGQHFRGAGVEIDKDERRLDSQYNRILNLMKDGVHRTLAEIAAITRDPEGSIIRQLSYIDDPRWSSGYKKKKEIRNGIRGLYEYWLVPNPKTAQQAAMRHFKAAWPGGPNP
jgi:hypothetical protein